MTHSLMKMSMFEEVCHENSIENSIANLINSYIELNGGSAIVIVEGTHGQNVSYDDRGKPKPWYGIGMQRCLDSDKTNLVKRAIYEKLGRDCYLYNFNEPESIKVLIDATAASDKVIYKNSTHEVEGGSVDGGSLNRWVKLYFQDATKGNETTES